MSIYRFLPLVSSVEALRLEVGQGLTQADQQAGVTFEKIGAGQNPVVNAKKTIIDNYKKSQADFISTLLLEAFEEDFIQEDVLSDLEIEANYQFKATGGMTVEDAQKMNPLKGDMVKDRELHLSFVAEMRHSKTSPEQKKKRMATKVQTMSMRRLLDLFTQPFPKVVKNEDDTFKEVGYFSNKRNDRDRLVLCNGLHRFSELGVGNAYFDAPQGYEQLLRAFYQKDDGDYEAVLDVVYGPAMPTLPNLNYCDSLLLWAINVHDFMIMQAAGEGFLPKLTTTNVNSLLLKNPKADSFYTNTLNKYGCTYCEFTEKNATLKAANKIPENATRTSNMNWCVDDFDLNCHPARWMVDQNRITILKFGAPYTMKFLACASVGEEFVKKAIEENSTQPLVEKFPEVAECIDIIARNDKLVAVVFEFCLNAGFENPARCKDSSPAGVNLAKQFMSLVKLIKMRNIDIRVLQQGGNKRESDGAVTGATAEMCLGFQVVERSRYGFSPLADEKLAEEIIIKQDRLTLTVHMGEVNAGGNIDVLITTMLGDHLYEFEINAGEAIVYNDAELEEYLKAQDGELTTTNPRLMFPDGRFLDGLVL